jgi:hypothetical protein
MRSRTAKLITLCLGLSLLLFSCNAIGGRDWTRGFVEEIAIAPARPVAGSTVDVEITLYDPYAYPGIDGAGAMADLQVSGGTLTARRWDPVASAYVEVTGSTLTQVFINAVRWTLPEQAGDHSITVAYDGDVKSYNLTTTAAQPAG